MNAAHRLLEPDKNTATPPSLNGSSIEWSKPLWIIHEGYSPRSRWNCARPPHLGHCNRRIRRRWILWSLANCSYLGSLEELCSKAQRPREYERTKHLYHTRHTHLSIYLDFSWRLYAAIRPSNAHDQQRPYGRNRRGRGGSALERDAPPLHALSNRNNEAAQP